MILGKDLTVSLDTHKTLLNNNVLVVGASGAGKTRGIVIPNLLKTSESSFIVSDPKGNLYDKCKKTLESRGYVVKKLDFTDPKNSAHYNFINYVHSSQDVVKVSHMLMHNDKVRTLDPFWDEAAQLLLQALIAYLVERNKTRNFQALMDLFEQLPVPVNELDTISEFEILMKKHELEHKNSFAASCYRKFSMSATRTLRSIMITLGAKLGLYDTEEIHELTRYDDIDIPFIGKRKTALFVVVSDTDRSLDGLVNIFFSQAMNELCLFADKCHDSRLPVPVRFIMDDFATNCCIDEFPRMISSIRSREISVMLFIQAESQLEEYYRNDAKTIIANCDTYVYMGGNDIETASAIARRCDLPLKKILYMSIGTSWVFRRGQEPILVKNFEPPELEKPKNNTYRREVMP